MAPDPVEHCVRHGEVMQLIEHIGYSVVINREGVKVFLLSGPTRFGFGSEFRDEVKWFRYLRDCDLQAAPVNDHHGATVAQFCTPGHLLIGPPVQIVSTSPGWH
jgi:hypothetical protein